MRAIIKDPTLWGRVRSAVVFAFTSKYAIALYVDHPANQSDAQVARGVAVDDLRALRGVPDGKLEPIPNLLQKVIQHAVIEVNGLADFGVAIEPIRKGG